MRVNPYTSHNDNILYESHKKHFVITGWDILNVINWLKLTLNLN